ncbi:MAG: hypothetical protein AB7P76_04160 [Candidatus Melainabacteria bacterium]
MNKTKDYGNYARGLRQYFKTDPHTGPIAKALLMEQGLPGLLGLSILIPVVGWILLPVTLPAGLALGWYGSKLRKAIPMEDIQKAAGPLSRYQQADHAWETMNTEAFRKNWNQLTAELLDGGTEGRATHEAPRELRKLVSRLKIEHGGKGERLLEKMMDIRRTTADARIPKALTWVGRRLPGALGVIKWPLLIAGLGLQALIYGIRKRPALINRAIDRVV